MGDPMADSPRWCAKCAEYGDHHTDKHPEDKAWPPKGIETKTPRPDERK